MEREQAELIAIKGLAFVAGDAERLSRFLGQTGADTAALTARAGDRDTLASVLDFILSDDSHVVAFAEEVGLEPEAIARVRWTLTGEI